MARTVSVTAVILLLMVSWVWAGSLNLLPSPEAAGTVTPLHAAPGSVIKAQFKTPAEADSDIRMESDVWVPAPAAAADGPRVTPRPAVAFKKRTQPRVAPPSSLTPERPSGPGSAAQTKGVGDDLEVDLERDLVIQPPPQQVEEKSATDRAVQPGRASEEQPVVRKKVPAQQPKAQVKKPAPSVHAAASKPIRKVRPVSQNPWATPASAHQRRFCPIGPDYAAIDEHRRVVPPPTTDRFVRDGVTIKLAPKPFQPAYPYPEEDLEGSDILSAATEIIGLPFAFISSLF